MARVQGDWRQVISNDAVRVYSRAWPRSDRIVGYREVIQLGAPHVGFTPGRVPLITLGELYKSYALAMRRRQEKTSFSSPPADTWSTRNGKG